MKIAVLGTKGIPNNYGGFEQFAEFLSVGLSQKGHSVTVYNPHFHFYDKSEFHNVIIKKVFSAEKIIGSSANLLYDYFCLKDALSQKFDIILECGYGSSSFSFCLLNIKKSIIVTNMDGIEWQRSKWGKLTKRILKIAEKLAIKKSNSIVSDNKCIKEYYANKYNINSEYIPYGAEVLSNYDKTYLEKYNLVEFDYYAIISRLEPENNIEIILDGFINSKSSDKIVIISNKDSKYAKLLIGKYRNFDKVLFIGNNFKQDELMNLRFYSKAYFHGHSVGGTNPSLLEAMASKSFIIAHNNIYNKSVLGTSAVYFQNSNDISNILNDIDNLLIDKNNFICLNLDKIKKDYNWENITNQYIDLFLRLMDCKNKLKYEDIQKC
jgi:glycosyltransferase involved in cell wall biosynthesis